MTKEKREMTLMEELILNSMAFDMVCPYCKKKIHVEPKDLIWQFGCVNHTSDGETKIIPSGFIYRCECDNDIPVAISIGVEDEKIQRKD